MSINNRHWSLLFSPTAMVNSSLLDLQPPAVRATFQPPTLPEWLTSKSEGWVLACTLQSTDITGVRLGAGGLGGFPSKWEASPCRCIVTRGWFSLLHQKLLPWCSFSTPPAGEFVLKLFQQTGQQQNGVCLAVVPVPMYWASPPSAQVAVQWRQQAQGVRAPYASR